jgi:hypothetical protein
MLLLSRESRAAHDKLGKAGRAMHVVIRIQGHLDQSWQQWLEELAIVQEPDGTSRLSGTLPDQAALYGVLNKLDRLSLTLLSLDRRETEPDEG